MEKVDLTQRKSFVFRLFSFLSIIFFILALRGTLGGLTIWFSFIPLFYLLDQIPSPIRAFHWSWCVGLGSYLYLAFWLSQVTTVGYFLLCFMLAMYFGFFGFFYKKWMLQESFWAIPILACLWTSLEYLRGCGPLAFPWFVLGYSQHAHLSFLQMISWSGSFGLSFFIVWMNRALYEFFFYYKKSLKNRLLFLGIGCIFLVGVYSSGLVRLQQRSLYNQESPALSVALIQANIPQDEKWDPVQANFILKKYERMTLQIASQNPALILWPETAMPGDFKKSRKLQEKIKFLALETNSYMCLGGNDDLLDTSGVITNAAYLINPEGSLIDQYDKIHLVPFGEYVPLRKWMPWLGSFTLGDIDFSPGKTFKVFTNGFDPFSVVICFEDILPHHVRSFVKSGAHWLVNLSNDGWFGRSKAAEEHFNLARFSAIANGVSLVRSTNTGVSGIISPFGEIQKRIEDSFGNNIEVEGSKVYSVQTKKVKTFYQAYGDLFSQICLGIVIIFGLLKFIFRKTMKHKEIEYAA